MKVSAAPTRVDDLLRFLRHIGYTADEIDYGVVRVEQAQEPAAIDVFALALGLQLRVWNLVNDAEARIIEVSGPLEPFSPVALEPSGVPGGNARDDLR